MFNRLWRHSFLPVVVVLGYLTVGRCADEIDVRSDGAFGFPQSEAQVLVDTDELRLSAWSNASFLYVQAIMWTDDSDEIVKGPNGRSRGDSSSLILDTDGDQKRTPKIDRTYDLNPWPTSTGLHYQIVISERGSTGLMPDSEGRGGIQYVQTRDGQTVRVDSYLIPLKEIELKTGDTLRLAFYGSSTDPESTVNSVGFQSESRYYSFNLPHEKFHDYTLSHGTTVDEKEVPELRKPRAKRQELPDRPAPSLTVGSSAPDLNIEHWVHDGNGKFQPVTKFEADKVYIVEFWATWCGPCIAAMPHIVELQKKHAEQGLQVVSISNEDLETVESFLERALPAQKKPAAADAEPNDKESADKEPATYGELTSAYCLTTDPDGSCHQAYMAAAGRNGIPCAFLVGKDGYIEWIGHPMSIDKPLESVLDGKWDRQAFLVEYREGERFSAVASEIMQSATSNKFDKALALIEKAEGEFDSPAIQTRIKLLVTSVKSAQLEYQVIKGQAEAIQTLQALLKDQPPAKVNQVVWQAIATPAIDGRKLSPELLAEAEKIMAAAIEQAPEDSHYLDTYAHLLELNGQLDKAIEVQEKAVASAVDQNRETVTEYLKQLQTKKEADASK